MTKQLRLRLGRRVLQHAFVDWINWQFQIELLKLDDLAYSKAFLLPALWTPVYLNMLLILAHKDICLKCRTAHITGKFLCSIISFGSGWKHLTTAQKPLLSYGYYADHRVVDAQPSSFPAVFKRFEIKVVNICILVFGLPWQWKQKFMITGIVNSGSDL